MDISNYDELFEVIVKLNDVQSCREFFSDLCTYRELDAMVGRVKAAKMLLRGETYETIVDKKIVSSATLSRVSRCVKYGQGYKRFLSALNDENLG